MATKKTARKKTRTKSAARAKDAAPTETPDAAANETAAASGTKPGAKRKKAATTKSRGRKTAESAAKADVAPHSAVETASAAPGRAERPAAKPDPEIERGGDSIVIRFPAAGTTRKPAAAPVAAEPTSAPPPRAQATPPPGEIEETRPAPPTAPKNQRDDEDAESGGTRGRRRPRRRGGRKPEADESATAASKPTRERTPAGGVAAADVESPPGEEADPETGRRRRRRRRRRGRGGGERNGADRVASENGDRGVTATDVYERPVHDEDEIEVADRWAEDVDPEVDLLDEPVEVADVSEEADEDEEVAEAPARERPESRSGPRRRRRRNRRGRGDDEVGDFALSPGPDVILDAEEIKETEPDAQAGPRVRREMIINIAPREECRIAILEDGRLQEIYLERASAESHVGNIYKGIVTNVEPSIQAAFVDFGLGKNGFLHISDLHPRYFPNGEGHTEDVGRKMPRRHRPPIQRCVRRGQELMVQITKEGIGTKGPTLTTYLSVPGRYLVMMPEMRQLGVSRKIEDDDVRRKLRAILNELELPDDIGFIARTAAEGRTKRELQNDLNYLTRLWRAVQGRIRSQKAPAELYRDSDLVIRTIRDVYSPDITRILVDEPEVAERAREFLGIFSPAAADTVQVYDGREPIFHRFGIEQELERLHSRHVPLKSGGSLVIDQAEALVAIDVNSGRFRTEDDAETTAFKINVEAADEIARQLRLRDLGGVVVCDFIDMRAERHRREIERRLVQNLKQHKERAKVLRMSAFGIIEMTRQRQRASLQRSVYQDCHHCRGTGFIKTPESVALDAMRLLQLACTRENIKLIELSLSSEVANLLLNRKRAALHYLESTYNRSITIKSEPNYGLDQLEIRCFDPRGRLAPHA